MELILLASLLGLGVALGGLSDAFSAQDDAEIDDSSDQDEATSDRSAGDDEQLDSAHRVDPKGTSGDDTLTGWNNLMGLEGDDYIRASNFGGEYQAVGLVDGGKGHDTIIAQSGQDGEGEIYGGEGNDVIVAHAGAFISAGDDDDLIALNASQLNHGEVLTGEGQDIVIFAPHSLSSGINSAEQPAKVDLTDFDQSKDAIGILIDPAYLQQMQYVREVDDEGSGTSITFFIPNTLNGIEAHAPLKINLPGVSFSSEITISLFEKNGEIDFSSYSSIVIPKSSIVS